MRRYPLLFLILFALAAGVLMAGSSSAGEKCCVRNDKGVCVPCPDKNTSASATTADTKQSPSCCDKAALGCCGRAKATTAQATTSSDTKQCGGKTCGPCKPGDKCDGKPCPPCKPGECKGSNGGCSKESKGSI